MRGVLGLVLFVVSLSCAPLLAREPMLLGVFPDRVLVEIDGQRHVLMMGADATEGVRLLSSDTRTGTAWLEIQGERRQVTSVRRTEGASRGDSVAQARVYPDASGALTAAGSINGHAVRFLVDTDTPITTLGAGEARRLGIAYARGDLTQTRTAAGLSFGYRVMLDQVRIGGIVLDDVEAVVLQSDAPRLPVLGASFLNRVQVQRQGRALLLER
nr:retropepsin-like aspartic protease [Thioalkalivibrio sp.]